MDKITQHKMFFLIVSLLLSIPFIVQLPNIKTVDNVDYFISENDPDVQFYNEIKDVFGNDEFFIIAFKKDEIFTSQNLNLLKKLSNELNELDEIKDAKSLANIDDTIGEKDYFIIQKFLGAVPDQIAALTKLKERALSNPLYIKNFISEDGKTVAIIVSVYDMPGDSTYRKRLIDSCHVVLDQYKEKLGTVYLSGWTTTNLYLSQYMKRDISTFIPLTYFFITMAVLLFFRNIWLTIIAVLNISFCMGTTMGLFPIFGITINNVTTIVPPLIMALSLCDTVHVFSHLDEKILKKFSDNRKALSYILKKIFVPCFLTTLTTGIGFLSLFSSDIRPIKDFALIASCGMIFELFFSFLFLPSLLLFAPKEKIFSARLEQGSFHHVLERINNFVQNNYRTICLLSFFLMLISFFFALQMKVDTNVNNYFKKNSAVRTSLDFIEKNLSGVGTIDISLKAESENAFMDIQNLVMIEKIQKEISKISGVDKTMSFVDFLKDMNKSFHDEQLEYFKVPVSKAMVAQYLLLYDSDEIEDFINSSYDHAKISVRISKHGTSEQKKIVVNINAIINKHVTENISIRQTGRIIQDINMIDKLVKGQVKSLSIAAAVIAVIMFFVMKTWTLGIISILPNFFPILLNFGIMGFIGIPLNAATALIAAVALGIAVDDTIHFLSSFQGNINLGNSISKSVKFSILEKGRAITLSSMILMIGFIVMVFSVFVPTIYFGLLSANIMLMAVIGDIIVLPSVLLMIYKHKKI